ncbi:hypothetical protein CBOM_08001 [Ceraceosorus bombacis]|uniref:Uncharacterized protein n=1 Tax=Ceraceosorus bombacis TaxID=401625 RepID=A0A0P1BJ43_9BASI|nr:hypothetical protein CBOM_08001 [Ceraceosorus bombacis]
MTDRPAKRRSPRASDSLFHCESIAPKLNLAVKNRAHQFSSLCKGLDKLGDLCARALDMHLRTALPQATRHLFSALVSKGSQESLNRWFLHRWSKRLRFARQSCETMTRRAK